MNLSMVEINLILVMSLILLTLAAILIVLFYKNLNSIYDFAEEMQDKQIPLYKEVLDTKFKPDNKDSPEQVSEEMDGQVNTNDNIE